MGAVEVLLLTYFSTFCLAALVMAGRRPRWRHAFGWSVAGIAVVLTARALSQDEAGLRWVADWWPLLALPIAYWVPAPLTASPNLGLERWLQSVDERLGFSRLDRGGHVALETAYLFVYPMVPAGLLALLAVAPDAVPGFWTALLVAVLPCYGLLPLFPTRPPRAFLRPDASSDSRSTAPRRANITFLATFGNRWNTLPSGHAAGAAAIAAFLCRVGSPLCSLFVLLAVGIALGTVRGRYHYSVDTILGVTLGIVTGLLS